MATPATTTPTDFSSLAADNAGFCNGISIRSLICTAEDIIPSMKICRDILGNPKYKNIAILIKHAMKQYYGSLKNSRLVLQVAVNHYGSNYYNNINKEQ